MLASILKRMNVLILLKKLASMLASFFARSRACSRACSRAPANKNDPMYFNGTVHTSACMLARMLASMLV